MGPAPACLLARRRTRTDRTYSCSCVSSQHRLHFIQPAAKRDISAECVKQRWRPGLPCRLCGRLTPPSHVFFLSPSLTLRPLLPSLLLFPRAATPPSNWLWKMASVSHLGTKIKGKLQPTSMQNVIWKPRSYVLTIDFSLSLAPSLSPHFSASFLSKHNTTQCEIWRKSPPEPSSRWNRKWRRRGVGCRGGSAVPGYACLHLESILWCK